MEYYEQFSHDKKCNGQMSQSDFTPIQIKNFHDSMS